MNLPPPARVARVAGVTTVTGVAAKICGLTLPADARHAERQGAAFLGAILAGGPRHLTVDRAAEVLGARRAGIQRAAVFGTQSVDEIVGIAATLDLDVIQLHAVERPDAIEEVRVRSGRTVWPVLRIAGGSLPATADDFARAAGWLVLDAHVVGQLGGTGVPLDWDALADDVRALRSRHPSARLVLAGGLRPTNVREAIQRLAPDVVDVSSGVESSPGVKDPGKVEEFVRTVGAVSAGIRDAG